MNAAVPRGLPAALLVAGWLALFGPTYRGLWETAWDSEAGGHGPLILALAAWLVWRLRAPLAAVAGEPAPRAGAALFALGAAAVVAGRALALPTLEVAAQSAVLAALLLVARGWGALRLAAFPILFLLFMVPWPASWAEAVTQPMKAAVSAAAVALLQAAGEPVARSGVVITAGPYQLLVADACAGLNSLFMLEAIGLLYVHLGCYRTRLRKGLLALAIPPLAFAANVVRVLLLVLATLHAGEAAGRGFAHDFAALALFVVALALVWGADRALAVLAPATRPAAGAA